MPPVGRQRCGEQQQPDYEQDYAAGEQLAEGLVEPEAVERCMASRLFAEPQQPGAAAEALPVVAHRRTHTGACASSTSSCSSDTDTASSRSGSTTSLTPSAAMVRLVAASRRRQSPRSGTMVEVT